MSVSWGCIFSLLSSKEARVCLSLLQGFINGLGDAEPKAELPGTQWKIPTPLGCVSPRLCRAMGWNDKGWGESGSGLGQSGGLGIPALSRHPRSAHTKGWGGLEYGEWAAAARVPVHSAEDSGVGCGT